jgi:hypothetical protein
MARRIGNRFRLLEIGGQLGRVLINGEVGWRLMSVYAPAAAQKQTCREVRYGPLADLCNDRTAHMPVSTSKLQNLLFCGADHLVTEVSKQVLQVIILKDWRHPRKLHQMGQAHKLGMSTQQDQLDR